MADRIGAGRRTKAALGARHRIPVVARLFWIGPGEGKANPRGGQGGHITHRFFIYGGRIVEAWVCLSLSVAFSYGGIAMASLIRSLTSQVRSACGFPNFGGGGSCGWARTVNFLGRHLRHPVIVEDSNCQDAAARCGGANRSVRVLMLVGCSLLTDRDQRFSFDPRAIHHNPLVTGLCPSHHIQLPLPFPPTREDSSVIFVELTVQKRVMIVVAFLSEAWSFVGHFANRDCLDSVPSAVSRNSGAQWSGEG